MFPLVRFPIGAASPVSPRTQATATTFYISSNPAFSKRLSEQTARTGSENISSIGISEQ
jgi:hypothetical protein